MPDHRKPLYYSYTCDDDMRLYFLNGIMDIIDSEAWGCAQVKGLMIEHFGDEDELMKYFSVQAVTSKDLCFT